MMTALRQASADSRATWGREQDLALEAGLRELAIDATDGQIGGLRRYGELLLKWNRTYNLLGATTADAMVREHLLDSLAVLPALAAWMPAGNATMVDVGSGAGLPGIVIAIMNPGLSVVLVEPVGKKAAFLRQAVAECRLPQVSVMAARIEDVPSRELLPATPRPGTPRTMQTGESAWMQPHFICRAFTSLDRFAGLCAPHLRDGSLLFAMKAARVPDEMQQLRSSVEVLAVEPLRTVEKDVQRNLVVMRSNVTHPASDPTGPVR